MTDHAALRRVIALMDLPRRRLLGATLAGAAAFGSAIGLIGVAAWLIARASQMPPVLDLSVAVVTVRALGIGRGVFRYLERLAGHDVALHGLVTLRERMYGLLAGARGPGVGSLHRGDVLARFAADVDELGDVVVRGLFPFAVAALVGTVSSLAAALILPVAGAALAAAVVIAGIVAPWLVARAAGRAHADLVEARSQISAAVLHHLEILAEREVAGTQTHSRQRLDRWQHRLERAQERAAGPSAVAAAVQVAATGFAVLVALLLGAREVEAGRLGEVWLPVITLLPLAVAEVCAGLPVAAAHLVAGARAAARLVALLPPDNTPAPATSLEHPPTGPGLCGWGLAVGWGRPLPGVPADVTLVPGRVTALVGRSGSGKTTLALTLAGLIDPLAGQVSLDGVPLPTVDRLPRRVNYTAHDAHIFGTTLRENLLVAAGPDTDDQTLVAALHRAGLRDWYVAQPAGLDRRLQPGGGDLSGGERRRLLLARALLTGADYLLLDEPTEHLDPDTARLAIAELTRLAHVEGIGVLVVTHEDLPVDVRIELSGAAATLPGGESAGAGAENTGRVVT